ncbi:hypothetical protein SAMN05421821_104110 [Mucilaginibacter lappiensis]|uniref:Uncharacterized protein n=1 Tax=Mucilaginibacter lappiensis TaxID=354630 RepID=A0A1N6WUS0_9SPHI|nr:hypothetical protein [Mucilaginibacter lappiensis]MBB6127715.1 hypothetical protein [Mucilaginibacter lappiensis]SIQ93778.1 hypothetical protein SAMN05421821_104110 [Mucilaginibacter lappiensis]
MIGNDSCLSVAKDIIIYLRYFNFTGRAILLKSGFTWFTQFMVNIDLYYLKSSS